MAEDNILEDLAGIINAESERINDEEKVYEEQYARQLKIIAHRYGVTEKTVNTACHYYARMVRKQAEIANENPQDFADKLPQNTKWEWIAMCVGFVIAKSKEAID